MRVQRFSVRVKTGDVGMEEPVRFCFNGHVMPFEQTSGGTDPGETFEGTFEPNSFAHHLSIEGPNVGAWAIERIEVSYVVDGADPYEVLLGPVRLDDDSCVNIWRERRIAAFDV